MNAVGAAPRFGPGPGPGPVSAAAALRRICGIVPLRGAATAARRVGPRRRAGPQTGSSRSRVEARLAPARSRARGSRKTPRVRRVGAALRGRLGGFVCARAPRFWRCDASRRSRVRASRGARLVRERAKNRPRNDRSPRKAAQCEVNVAAVAPSSGTALDEGHGSPVSSLQTCLLVLSNSTVSAFLTGRVCLSLTS